MNGYDRFRLRMDRNGSSRKQEQLNHAKLLIDDCISDDITSYTITVNDIPDVPCRVEDKSSLNKKHGYMSLKTQMDYPIYIGDRIEFDDKYFICTSSRNVHDIYYSSIIEQCNYNLKWIKDKKIMEQWAIVGEVSANSLGIDDTKIINFGDTRMSIILPINDNTLDIQVGNRFLIDIRTENPNAFKVTKIDAITNYIDGHGTLSLILEQCALSENDNTELMIADYYNNEIEIEEEEKEEIDVPTSNASVSITCNDGQNIIKVGKSKSFFAEFTDVTEPFDIIWELINENDLPVTIKYQEENKVTLSMQLDTSYIGSTFGLKVSDSNGETSSEITIEVRGVV